MNYTLISTAAGGLALFLLAMLMMTDGLKAFGGSGLKRLLGRGTSSPARGVIAGMLVRALVQSSSAVTVATIGFVNAGVLTLRQALGVIFGTNVGTTVTGWLVSLVGCKRTGHSSRESADTVGREPSTVMPVVCGVPSRRVCADHCRAASQSRACVRRGLEGSWLSCKSASASFAAARARSRCPAS